MGTEYLQGARLIHGFVRDNRDPESLGRVRVRFLAPDSGEEMSEWARLLMPYASKAAGFHFIPEVGDEVMIAFTGGDHASPVVVGSLYNEEQRPPSFGLPGDSNGDGRNTLRAIKTRTGFEISISETEDDARLRIHDGEGLDLVMSRSDQRIALQDKQGNRVEIASGENRLEVTDRAGNRLFIQDGKVELEAKQSIVLGAGGAHPVPLGDLVMKLFNTHIHNTGVGPSSPPTQPMTDQHLSQLTTTR